MAKISTNTLLAEGDSSHVALDGQLRISTNTLLAEGDADKYNNNVMVTGISTNTLLAEGDPNCISSCPA